MFDRIEITNLTADQIAPLEALMSPEWSDTWRELATSQFITLLSAPGAAAVAPGMLAQLAVELTMGIAQDLGGTQPYNNQGRDMKLSGMAAREIDLIASTRQDYARVAQLLNMSERHVRRIEARWLRAERARRQGTLALE